MAMEPIVKCKICGQEIAVDGILNSKITNHKEITEILWHLLDKELHMSIAKINGSRIDVIDSIETHIAENSNIKNLLSNKIFPLIINKREEIWFRKTKNYLDIFVIKKASKRKSFESLLKSFKDYLTSLEFLNKITEKSNTLLKMIEIGYLPKSKSVKIPLIIDSVKPIRIFGVIVSDEKIPVIHVKNENFVFPIVNSRDDFYKYIPVPRNQNALEKKAVQKVFNSIIIRNLSIPLLFGMIGIAYLMKSLLGLPLRELLFLAILIWGLTFYAGYAKYKRYQTRVQKLTTIMNANTSFWQSFELTELAPISEDSLLDDLYEKLAVAALSIKTNSQQKMKESLFLAYQDILKILNLRHTGLPFNEDIAIKNISKHYRIKQKELYTLEKALDNTNTLSVLEGARIYNKLVDLCAAVGILADLTKIPIEVDNELIPEKATTSRNLKNDKLLDDRIKQELSHKTVIEIKSEHSNEKKPIFYTVTDQDELRDVIMDLKDQTFLIFVDDDVPIEEEFNNHRIGVYLNALSATLDEHLMVVLTSKDIVNSLFDYTEHNKTPLLLLYNHGKIEPIDENQIKNLHEKLAVAQAAK